MRYKTSDMKCKSGQRTTQVKLIQAQQMAKKQAREPAQKQWKLMHFLKMAMVKKINLTEDGKPAKTIAK